MRLGQKNGRVRQWARKGTRPRQPADQRYQNAYLFGAICPHRQTGAAIMMPKANTHAMQLHLGDQLRSCQRRSWCGADGPGRMAHHRQAECSQKHLDRPAAVALAGAEPGGERLAVHAPELALEPRLPNLRCHSRCWMRRLEQAPRPAGPHQINRSKKMGPHRSKLTSAGISLIPRALQRDQKNHLLLSRMRTG